jgi:light-regulated signal transduction histidine kinase (bacteriophytochrome)
VSVAVPPAPQAAPAGHVTLANCEDEPIHIPGAIQSHGALIALDAHGRLLHHSANAADWFGDLPALGQPLTAQHLHGDAALHALLADLAAVGGTDTSTAPRLHSVVLGGRPLDLLLHGGAGLRIVEAEAADTDPTQLAHFALQAHRAIGEFRHQRDLGTLLQRACEAVRAVTGFDRVMGYRFRHDDSGDIVAEARAEHLVPLLGRRYPASDIPAQARRLYVLNTLRLIGDVRSAPVALLTQAAAPPLDMSHCALRAVSPIHIEYLRNMGVAASMSVSIVIGNRLWGMLACHHHQPRRVPPALRLACDVAAQVLAGQVQALLAHDQARTSAQLAGLRARLAQAWVAQDDMLAAAQPLLGDLRDSLAADAVLLRQGGRQVADGPPLPDGLAAALTDWALAQPMPLQMLHQRAQWPAPAQALAGRWCGVLALVFDPTDGGVLLLLRREQIETVRWGGEPTKVVATGPNGPRLTPRGSFDEWRQTVRDTAVPWSCDELEGAQRLLDDLHRHAAARRAEVERARMQMLAMLGHDLRDPLQSISMAAQVLERGAGAQRLGQRIRASSSRMQRLVGQVLDLSRLQNGLGLGLQLQAVDLVALLHDLAHEVSTAHPGSTIALHAPDSLVLQADPDRLAQLLGNLLGNARHHGEPGQPVAVEMTPGDGGVTVAVRNTAPPIDDRLLPTLFQAFKRADDNGRHRGGLGLGLHIANEIARAHGGSLRYSHVPPHVVFTLWLPDGAAPA